MADATDPKQKTKLVAIEEKVLSFWEERGIFQKSLEKKGKDFIFYDGPPFATGLPHFGHLLPTTIKDVIPRYKTMQGFRVVRRWGWDCHGLPVENLIEKELGLKTRNDIIEYGIDRFNAAAKQSVLRYADEWRKIVPRIGRWVDMENDYRTMDAGYTQSVWWAFKELSKKGLVYEGFKAMQYCPRCGTTLSNFEVNQGYKDISDISVYVRLAVKGKKDEFFLAWTTTPWTLPGNVALAVGADIEYARVSHAGATYILAHARVADVFAGKEHSLDSIVKGTELVGLSYEPIFGYYDMNAIKNGENGYKVYAADFVTTEDGSGIVHIAPAFGEDDLRLGQAKELPFIQHVAPDGRFKPEVVDFAGQEAKPKAVEKDGHQKGDIEVIKWLAHHGSLFEKRKIVHSYPHCWRCDTPLLNYATSSWFVKVTAIKDKLVAANRKTRWTPEEIRDGRFGKWLEGARDWAVSRSRFWGAPIPVWRGKESGAIYTVGSLDDLKGIVKRSGNTYILARHGESESNARGVSNSDIHKSADYPLTEKGRAEAAALAKKIAASGADIIVASDFERTKETARLIADACGIAHNAIVYDERLREYSVGPEREGRSWRETEAHVRAHGPYPGMEEPEHLKRRVFAALYDVDRRYAGKRIVIVSHGSPLNTLMHGVESEAGRDKIMHDERRYFLTTAESHPLEFVRLPVDADFDLDLHRPHIDQVEYQAPDGETLSRVPEVFDCWFESGSMPFAEACYQGKAQPHFDPKGIMGGLFKRKKGYPADFIAEGLDQTRGWFYTLSVLGTALFGEVPFKNVIVNGLILAEDGQKMAKSKNNYPPLMDTVNKYGADSLRYFMASSPAVKAEDVRFSEKGVDEVSKKLLQRLDNVLSFYEMYADDKAHEKGSSAAKASAAQAPAASRNALDRWILSRLSETRDEVTAGLEAYQIDRAARPLMSFVDDLSTWYLRRSRDRFKSDDAADKSDALRTTRLVLREFAKVMAPFTPFYAEYLFEKTRGTGDPESVHLCDWPKAASVDSALIADMAEARRIVTVGLEQRAKANIKVRQPLAKLSVRKTALSTELLSIIKDEMNVKSVVVDPSIESEAFLDAHVTDDLRREGVVRDLIRAVQEMRKAQGLTVGDKVSLVLDSDEKAKELVREFLADIKRVTLVTGVDYAHLPDVQVIEIEGYSFKVALRC
jgi:isoleucyl-tRNA synthetase